MCPYGLVSFARNCFASISCSCVKSNKDTVCHHCVNLRNSLNMETKKICLKLRAFHIQLLDDLLDFSIFFLGNLVIKKKKMKFLSKIENQMIYGYLKKKVGWLSLKPHNFQNRCKSRCWLHRFFGIFVLLSKKINFCLAWCATR